MHELLMRFAAKLRSVFTSAGHNLVTLESDTGDFINARLQEIEREIVRLKGAGARREADIGPHGQLLLMEKLSFDRCPAWLAKMHRRTARSRHAGDAVGCLRPDGTDGGVHRLSAQSKEPDMPWVECMITVPEAEALARCACEKTAT